MSLLRIAIYGDKILRKKAQKVSDINFNTIEIIKNMFETMRNACGIGLAANQIGTDKQIFIVDISVVEGYEKVKPLVFINPSISEVSDEEVIFEEGCLSIP
ncbi:MAG: peptide deformylase, partial [Ignavibacteriaceae bacterium]|nr:peptide deformylase [Ignavibacteriaceae bacterium]